MSQEKVYCGKVKEITTKFGKITKVSYGPDDKAKLLEHWGANGWINLDIMQGRSGEQYMQIDTFKSNAQGGGGSVQNSAPKAAPVNQQAPSDDLPF